MTVISYTLYVLSCKNRRLPEEEMDSDCVIAVDVTYFIDRITIKMS